MAKQKQLLDIGEYIFGVFARELKNRFLCEVKIDGKMEECYVPSSCHLSNFLQLKGKRVALAPTQGKNARTRYALFAMPYKRNYIILNTSLSHTAVESSIHSRRFSFLGTRKVIIREHYIEGYKADFYIPNSKTIIEIKSVLSIADRGAFPTVYSERTQDQLKSMQCLLERGYRVCFICVSLNPYLQGIIIDEKTEFYTEFSKCIEKGMTVKAYASCLNNFEIAIKREILISYRKG